MTSWPPFNNKNCYAIVIHSIRKSFVHVPNHCNDLWLQKCMKLLFSFSKGKIETSKLWIPKFRNAHQLTYFVSPRAVETIGWDYAYPKHKITQFSPHDDHRWWWSNRCLLAKEEAKLEGEVKWTTTVESDALFVMFSSASSQEFSVLRTNFLLF